MRKKVRTFCIRWAKGHPCCKGQRFTTRFAISSLTNAKWVGPSKDSPAVCPIGLRIFPRDLGYVRAFFETLGDNPRLLLGRPPAPPTLPCDQFDPAIPPSSCLASSMAFAIAQRQRSAYAGCIAGD